MTNATSRTNRSSWHAVPTLQVRCPQVINYDIYVDLFVTVLLMFLLAGTFSGRMAALTAGTIVSVLLFFMKRTMRHESYGVIKTDKFPYRKFGWRTHDPKGVAS